MLVSFGPMVVAETPDGAEVVQSHVRFGSQAEQVQFLRAMVDQFREQPAIRARARDIVFRQYGCRPKYFMDHAIAIGSWVQNNVTYANEIPEVFQTPSHTLYCRYGDCDDFTTLICSLLESVGIESELVALEWDGAFRHIFPVACVPGRMGQTVRLPLDATLSQPVADLANPIEIARRKGYRLKVYVA